MNAQSVIYEDEQQQLADICQRLQREALAKAVFLLDRNGQVIVATGEVSGIDVTSLASLVAGTAAATSSLAKLLGEPEFPVHFHEGKRDHLHISLAGEEFILTVIFDQRSSLGLVRLRVKKATERLEEAFVAMQERRQIPQPAGASLFDEITDDDIDNLFGDGF